MMENNEVVCSFHMLAQQQTVASNVGFEKVFLESHDSEGGQTFVCPSHTRFFMSSEMAAADMGKPIPYSGLLRALI